MQEFTAKGVLKTEEPCVEGLAAKVFNSFPGGGR
jgi:hypothetical protein